MKQPKLFTNAVIATGPTNETTNNEIANSDTINNLETVNHGLAAGGLRMRTDLRAGLAWDDLDDKAQELWSNLTASLSNLTGGDAS